MGEINKYLNAHSTGLIAESWVVIETIILTKSRVALLPLLYYNYSSRN